MSEHAAAHDPISGRTLLFGGELSGGTYSSGTWLYGPSQPAAWTSFGPGCPGSNGIPRLAPIGADLPWLGTTCRMAIDQVPAGALVLPWLGLSRTTALGNALPLELSTQGMPGCHLRVAPDAPFVVTATGNTASWPLVFPAQPAFVGLSMYAQALVLDPTANSLGATLSNAGDLRLGGL